MWLKFTLKNYLNLSKIPALQSLPTLEFFLKPPQPKSPFPKKVSSTLPHPTDIIPQLLEMIPQLPEMLPQPLEVLPQLLEMIPQVIEMVPQVLEMLRQCIEMVNQHCDSISVIDNAHNAMIIYYICI